MIALHLLRHAHARDPVPWTGDDALRPLSEKGRGQAERLGRTLVAMADGPDLFITSPRLRAAQTAEIVAKALGAPVVVDDRLGGPLDAEIVTAILRSAGPAERPCLVGHDPEFSELLGELLGVPEIVMRKGAIARVDLQSEPIRAGSGVLRYLVPPEILSGR